MKRYALAISLFAAVACTTTPADPGETAAPGEAAEPATSTAISELGNLCTIQCRNGYTQCNSACLRNPNPNCETNCDTRFLNCMRVCGCPFSEEFDTFSHDHSEQTNEFLCIGPATGPGFTYRKINMFTRRDHIRRTLGCDGLTTETVVSSTVFLDGPCYRSLFPASSCPFPQVSSNAVCIL
jgi:hypothetical protein